MTKLNLGCGKDIKPDYINLDLRKVNGVDIMCSLNSFPYPFCVSFRKKCKFYLNVLSVLHYFSF